MADGRQSSTGGRGRGRARTADQPTSAAPPGAIPAQPPSSSTEVVGRRGVMGRRAETDKPEETSPTDKNRRASPADVSPTDAEKMAGLELISLAQRPGLGRLGRPYRICVNHFEMRIVSKVLTVNHYHVEISHASPTVKLDRDDNRPILWQCLLKNNIELEINRDDMYKIAFDGVANLYTLNPLKLPKENLKRFAIELMIPKFDKPTNLTVLIQAVGPIAVDLSQVVSPPSGSKYLTPIQILDVILRQYRSNPLLDSARAFYPFGPSIYMIPGYQGAPGGIDLQGGREIWRGLYTSAHVGEHFRAFVNMDMAHTAFFKQGTNGDGNGNGGGKYTCIMFLCEVLNAADRGGGNYRPDQMNEKTSINDTMLRVFEREIKGLKVCKDYAQPGASNQSRHYKVWGVDVGAALIKFKNREEVETSVAEYFRSQYGSLRYPLMPTLKVGKKSRPIHLPIEHCYMARCQKSNKKLTENQTAIMIRQTCMPPADRKHAIEQMVQTARFQADPFLKNFGIEVSPKMLDVSSRVLNAPPILYANSAPCQVRDGVWRAGNMRFHLPARAIGVAAIAFQPPGAPPDAKNFIAKLLQTCNQAGMQVPNPSSVFFHLEMDNSPQRVEKAMKYVVQQMKTHNVELSLAIVFVPVKGSPLYPEIKRVAEVQMGIMTQCVTNKTVGKCSPDTLSNIVFKINMKLGGINCELSTRDSVTRCLFSEPTLVLGIDVTHPGPTDKRSPSIASVVGSMDLSMMRYAASVKVQKQRREHLVYLSEPVTERLMYFYKATKVKPNRIIVFRDGVSEGEFKTVLREELRGIREACLKVDAAFKPKITFVVVQKRHHTRFFPANPDEGCGRAKNVFPGTVLDNTILFHEDFNFYLCSHAGIQGTSRPTRYHVLHDDNHFSPDDMQSLTYYLCHCFSRCTRAVSIPAPVYYAHLVCTRSRAHLINVVGDALSDTASTRSGDQGHTSSIPEEQLIQGASVTDNIRKEMYFT